MFANIVGLGIIKLSFLVPLDWFAAALRGRAVTFAEIKIRTRVNQTERATKDFT